MVNIRILVTWVWWCIPGDIFYESVLAPRQILAPRQDCTWQGDLPLNPISLDGKIAGYQGGWVKSSTVDSDDIPENEPHERPTKKHRPVQT